MEKFKSLFGMLRPEEMARVAALRAAMEQSQADQQRLEELTAAIGAGMITESDAAEELKAIRDRAAANVALAAKMDEWSH